MTKRTERDGRARTPRPRPAVARARRATWLGAAALVAAAVAIWFVVGEVSRVAEATRLPQPPDPPSVPAPVHAQVLEADAAARAQPRSAELVGELAMVYHANQDDARADQAYARAEALDDADWRWPYYRALLAESRGRSEEALSLLARALERNPAVGLAWFRTAEIELKAGRLDAAARAYERAQTAPRAAAPSAAGDISLTPPVDAYAATGLARIALERGDARAARVLLEPLITQRPPFGPALRLGRQLTPSNDAGRPYVPPGDPLVDAVVNRSRHIDLLLKHAALAARAGDRARREFLVRRALAYYPQDPNVLLEMAAMLQASGRAAEALDYLKRHEGVDPDDHHGLVEQGRCLIDLGRLGEAEQVLRRAARVRDAAAEYNLGVAIDRQGRWEEAQRHYERALAIDSFHARALNNLAVGLARRGDAASARALHERAVAAAPDNPEVHTNLATALLIEGRSAEAIASLERALVLDPESADAYNNLGVALAQLGRLGEAASQFREALRLNPSHTDARRNLERLGS